MTTIEKKIKDKYEHADNLIDLIREFQLENVINQAIHQIELKLTGGKITDLPKLSGIILNDINSYVSKITDTEKKKQIEYLLGDIFQDYLTEILQSKNSESVLTEIQANIQAACEYRGYDYEKLSSFLNIEKKQILLPKQNQRSIYYDWNGELQELDELARDICDMRLILSVKEFKKLFKPVSGHLSVKCYRENIDKLLILFQVLKESCLITPKGKGNSGHFAPFVQYSVDKDGNFLIEKSANKEHEKLKRNASRYDKLHKKMESVVKANAGKSMRQRKDNGDCPPVKGK
ncbi:hypothetical protein FLAV_02193 [Flavobacteriales bacterium]|nr:hypothetical protein FLAV_02193 [Flavobacteriales bacterium]